MVTVIFLWRDLNTFAETKFGPHFGVIFRKSGAKHSHAIIVSGGPFGQNRGGPPVTVFFRLWPKVLPIKR